MSGYRSPQTPPPSRQRCTWKIEMPANNSERRCSRPRQDGTKLCQTHLKVAKKRQSQSQ